MRSVLGGYTLSSRPTTGTLWSKACRTRELFRVSTILADILKLAAFLAPPAFRCFTGKPDQTSYRVKQQVGRHEFHIFGTGLQARRPFLCTRYPLPASGSQARHFPLVDVERFPLLNTMARILNLVAELYG